VRLGARQNPAYRPTRPPPGADLRLCELIMFFGADRPQEP
jgi:hypothetical protein